MEKICTNTTGKDQVVYDWHGAAHFLRPGQSFVNKVPDNGRVYAFKYDIPIDSLKGWELIKGGCDNAILGNGYIEVNTGPSPEAGDGAILTFPIKFPSSMMTWAKRRGLKATIKYRCADSDTWPTFSIGRFYKSLTMDPLGSSSVGFLFQGISNFDQCFCVFNQGPEGGGNYYGYFGYSDVPIEHEGEFEIIWRPDGGSDCFINGVAALPTATPINFGGLNPEDQNIPKVGDGEDAVFQIAVISSGGSSASFVRASNIEFWQEK